MPYALNTAQHLVQHLVLQNIWLNLMDKDFGNRLQWLRENMHLKQTEAAEKTGIKVRSMQSHEVGQWPNRNNLQKYIDFYGCNKVWLLTGEGEPFPGEGVREPVAEYKAADDPFARSVSGLRQIFESRDQALIAAIQINIQAFQLSVQKDLQMQRQSQEIKDLKEECDALRKRITALEDRLTGMASGPAGDLTKESAT